MGQYYKALVIGEGGYASVIDPFDYDNTFKLMEHSYIGNQFVNAVQSLLWKAPKKLAWIGDYSADFNSANPDPYERKISEDEFKKLYDMAWSDDDDDCKGLTPLDQDGGTAHYLVNHTRKCFVNLAEFWDRNKWHEHSDWNGQHEEWDICIHPLPLLTACGNGRGGGDYHDCHPDYDQCGTWAFDMIEVTDAKPAGYKQALYTFAEC